MNQKMNLQNILADAASGRIANWNSEQSAQARQLLTEATDREAADALYGFVLDQLRASHSAKVVQFTALAKTYKNLFH